MRPMKFRGNVFVANLPKGMKDEQLAEAFDRFGLVLGAFVARDSANGTTKGHGLVNIAPQRAAADAVEAMNGMEIGRRKIEVRLAAPGMALRMPRPARPTPRNPRVATEHGATSERTPERRAVAVEYRRLAR